MNISTHILVTSSGLVWLNHSEYRGKNVCTSSNSPIIIKFCQRPSLAQNALKNHPTSKEISTLHYDYIIFGLFN